MELKKNNNYLTLIALFGLCTVVNIVVYIILGGYNGWDLQGHWAISAYTLRGVNPYPLIGSENLPFADIAGIPANFSTVPWCCLLGSAFYAGFLPVAGAAVFNCIMHFVFLILTAFVMYKTFDGITSSKKAVLLSLLILCAHFSFMYSVYYGNAGGIICCMLIMSVYLAKDKPYISGILLALAMAKPQIAAIVCIIYVFEGRWKALITGAIIDIVAWIAVSFMTDTAFFDLLTQTFSSGTASDVQYLGLFSVLRHMGLPKGAVLVLNVITGCAYTTVLWYYLKKNSNTGTNSLVLFVPACIASTFWIYKNGTDYMILAFAVIFLCLVFMRKDLTLKDRILAFVCMGYLQMSRCAVYAGIILTDENPVLADLVKSVDGLLIAIAGIVFCILWKKYYKKKRK